MEQAFHLQERSISFVTLLFKSYQIPGNSINRHHISETQHYTDIVSVPDALSFWTDVVVPQHVTNFIDTITLNL